MLQVRDGVLRVLVPGTGRGTTRRVVEGQVR